MDERGRLGAGDWELGQPAWRVRMEGGAGVGVGVWVRPCGVGQRGRVRNADTPVQMARVARGAGLRGERKGGIGMSEGRVGEPMSWGRCVGVW
jgi:hypothetical protein